LAVEALPAFEAKLAYDAVLAYEAETTEEPDPAVVANSTTVSVVPTCCFMKALPSLVFRAISPNSSDDVVGILPGYAERFNLILTAIFMDPFVSIYSDSATYVSHV
jgi:hypothetical protein